MKGLIQKSGYIQPGSGGEQYVRYIATRDGVERMESGAGSGYLEYMAERPRSHGLFSADGTADLAEMMKEISKPRRSGVDFHLLPETGGCRPAGIRNGRELAQAAAGSPDGAGGSDEDPTRGLPMVRCLPR